MFEDIRMMMSDEIASSDWMPEDLKNHIYQKVNFLSVHCYKIN